MRKRTAHALFAFALLFAGASCVPIQRTISQDLLGYLAPTSTVGTLDIFACQEKQFFISSRDFTNYSGEPYRLGIIIRSSSIKKGKTFPLQNLVLKLSVYNCTTRKDEYSGIVYWPTSWADNEKRNDERFLPFLVFKGNKLQQVLLPRNMPSNYQISVTVLNETESIQHCQAFLAIGTVILESLPFD